MLLGPNHGVGVQTMTTEEGGTTTTEEGGTTPTEEGGGRQNQRRGGLLFHHAGGGGHGNHTSGGGGRRSLERDRWRRGPAVGWTWGDTRRGITSEEPQRSCFITAAEDVGIGRTTARRRTSEKK